MNKQMVKLKNEQGFIEEVELDSKRFWEIQDYHDEHTPCWVCGIVPNDYAKLQQQLAEKDKEIRELKFQIEDKKGGCELCKFSKELRDVDIRHQICEEIRSTAQEHLFCYIIDKNKLDQIEKENKK